MYTVRQKNSRHAFLLSLLLGLGVMAFFASAQLAAAQNAPPASNYKNYDTTGKTGLVQCGNNANDPCTVEDAFNAFIIATNLAIGAVGLIAIYGIVWSAFGMVRSDGNTETITAAKKSFTNSLVGLGMVLLALIFVNLVLYGILGVQDKGVLKNPAQFIGNYISGSNQPASNNGNTNDVIQINSAPQKKP